jgi:TolB-like protein/Flp pilus assembly protein TadD/predicted Ser/Thr protein kinase
MIGRTLSHYRIEAELGAGGMGVVYRAQDERLKRTVALKVLPEQVLGDEAARRLLRTEAAALLRLGHPRIGTILDFDTEAGVDFIVMEYCPGETLERRLSRGRMSQAEALGLAIQIAEALEEAHDQGVVHRDLKPGNVIVSPRGQVKVVDFGLAKLFQRPGEQGLAPSLHSSSQEHTLKGTLAYMAPEQLLSGQVDSRTDVYALGVLLYEMLTGDRPFRGESSVALIQSILNTAAAAPRALDRRVPAGAERVVMRCLEKDPRRRYPDASALLADLRAGAAELAARGRHGRGGRPAWVWAGAAAALLLVAFLGLDVAGLRSRLTGGAGPHPIRSIAVLPLANRSSDPQQEYFAEGMTDALITDLAKIPVLKVISRTSVMRYRNTRASLRSIARELGVDAVLEGAITQSGDEVRISVELIDASSDQNLWAQSYDRTLENALAVQREISGAIAEEIRVRLTPRERSGLAWPGGGSAQRPAGAHVPGHEAQDAYVKGRYFSGKATEGMLRIGLRCFEDAVASDSLYAQAWAGVANASVLLAAGGGASGDEGYGRAEEAARRALALDPTLADAHTSLALALLYQHWDWSAAERELRQAIALNPGSAQAYNWYAGLLSATGRHAAAITAARKAAELDPLSVAVQLNVAVRLYYARRYDEAAADLRRVLELEPGLSATHYWLGLTLEQMGRPAEAIAELRKVEDPSAIGPLGVAYAAAGRRAEARRMLDDLAGPARAGAAYVSKYDLAVICASLGQRDEAFEWLNHALNERASFLTTVKVDPLFDPLRLDPRFANLARRMGLPS